MKKILFTFATILLGSITMFAEIAFSAKATLTLSSVKGASDAVYLYESSSFSADQDETYDVLKLMNDVESVSKVVNLYANPAWGNASSVAESSLDGVKLTFQANKKADDVYTITFTNVSGTQYYLKDNMEKSLVDPTKDSLTAIVASGTYTFTQTKETTEQRFEIVSDEQPNYKRQQTTGNWGTFCYPEAISSVTGAEVYSFVGKDETKVYGVQVTTFPLVKGQAYLFKATADAQSFNYTDDATATDPVDNNGLVGKFALYTTTTGDEAAYVVKGTSLVPAALGSTVPANRAYVKKLSDIEGGAPAPGRKYVAFSINNPTAIEAVQAAGVKEGKMIVNGQFVIVKDGKMFNAQGAAL